MTDLSPTAQAVLNASNLLPGKDSYLILAAALRAAADELLPVRSEWHEAFIAIADELETSTTENQ